jgi:hypothetical protein
MKDNNLETALRRYELSPWNDKVTYEKHYYNGFSGLEGVEAYQSYLEGLYVKYFVELREQTDKLVLINIDTMLKFLKTKIDMFNEINDTDCNYCIRWIDYNSFQDLIERNNTADREILEHSQGAVNENGVMKFFRQMTGVQLYFIERAISELTQIYNTYNPQPLPKAITEKEMDKEVWDNTLKGEKDILDTSDLARIFNKKNSTIRRWAREGIFNPIDRYKRPQQFRKDEIKKYYLKIRER